eukprot:scaffold700_cov560-Prasinococcus_capsulatus_cf.AAC.16
MFGGHALEGSTIWYTVLYCTYPSACTAGGQQRGARCAAVTTVTGLGCLLCSIMSTCNHTLCDEKSKPANAVQTGTRMLPLMLISFIIPSNKASDLGNNALCSLGFQLLSHRLLAPLVLALLKAGDEFHARTIIEQHHFLARSGLAGATLATLPPPHAWRTGSTHRRPGRFCCATPCRRALLLAPLVGAAARTRCRPLYYYYYYYYLGRIPPALRGGGRGAASGGARPERPLPGYGVDRRRRGRAAGADAG